MEYRLQSEKRPIMLRSDRAKGGTWRRVVATVLLLLGLPNNEIIKNQCACTVHPAAHTINKCDSDSFIYLSCTPGLNLGGQTLEHSIMVCVCGTTSVRNMR